ncbi:MAG: radical SAM protein [Candidatus Thiodiazotropha sp.]
MLYPSKYNHLTRINTPDGQSFRIVSNLFFGSSNIVNESVFNAFKVGENTGGIPDDLLSEDANSYFLERFLLRENKHEEEQMITETAGTYGNRDQIAAGLHGGQYGFITSLFCNLDCPYCFQKSKADSCGFLSKNQIDLGLSAIEKSEQHVEKIASVSNTIPKISITGGEPLLHSKTNLESLGYLVEQISARNWPFNITTNGTELDYFVEHNKLTSRCRNIQVTLDGPKEVHDTRRYFRGGSPSFDRIVSGVDSALSAGWKITLRVNLDMNNVSSLHKLAEFIELRGWNTFENFSAYASPVTDHGEIMGHDEPKDEADLLEHTLAEIEVHPQITNIFDIKHFRGFNYVKQMLVDKRPRYPVIFRCEAVTGMYIFDPNGDVHVCLESVGNSNLRIGRYDPEWKIDQLAFDKWAKRNVLQLEYCRDCKIRFVCAGGCALESFNKKGGEYCMPFLREMDIAWDYFARNNPELFD